MPENVRLRRAWEQLPKTVHGQEFENRHPDVRPEWIMRVIGSQDSYEWIEYSTTRDAELRVWTIYVGWVAEAARWLEVVFEGFPDDGEFDTAYRLRDKQAAQRLRGRTRRS